MSRKASCRVYWIAHRDGRYTGLVMPRFRSLLGPEPPSAYGESVADVLAQLDVDLKAREATGEPLERYFWDAELHTRTVEVPLYPQRAVGKRLVVGAAVMPLKLTFAWSESPGGGYRLDLPRFGWSIVVEDLAVAPEVLAHAVSGALLGEKPRFLFDFRHEGGERVASWQPKLVARPDGEDDDDAEDRRPDPVLVEVAEDWVARARARRLPPVVGDDRAFRGWESDLCEPLPRSYLLVGPRGVGKTAWVRRLARLLAAQRPARGERRKRLWATSRDRVVAGMVYLGQWQERALALVEALRFEGDYLYLDRLSDVVARQGGGGSLAEMLEPALVAGELALIAECSEGELEAASRAAPAFVDRFELIYLWPPSEAQVIELLGAWQERRDPSLTWAPDAARRVVRNLRRFRPDQAFPGKMFQLLDRHHAARANASAGQGQTTGSRRRPEVVSAAAADAIFAELSGLPPIVVSDELAAPSSVVAEALGARVIGQAAAVEAAAEVVVRFKAGLADPGRPLGVLLFAGPTGVGKTQLAKELARYLFGDPARLVRADMSEYMLPGSARRLFEVGGGVTSLAGRVREEPLSVVLFDELEKAHPEVFDALLAVLDEGRVTDSGGRVVSFAMTVIVMTSNLGAGDRPLGGFAGSGVPDSEAAIKRHFRPEFVNRLDRVVSFSSLSEADLVRIVDLELAEVAAREGLVRRGLRLVATEVARRELAHLGHDPKMGARPLKRVIEEKVVSPIAALLASRGAPAGATLTLDLSPSRTFTLIASD